MNPISSTAELYLAPLYLKYRMTAPQYREIDLFTGPLHMWCIHCRRDSVFNVPMSDSSRYLAKMVHSPSDGTPRFPDAPQALHKQFACAADRQHIAVFSMILDRDIVFKVGQFPSRSDLTHERFARYRKISEENYRELVRASNLAASDVHIAAYVYLRRIFERLVEDAANARQAREPNWDKEGWSSKRMGEKIDEVSIHLPEFLLKHKAKVYGILSKGIHELSEEACANYFPIVLGAIEAILGQELVRREQAARESEVARALSQAKV
jgi:hypothetical protein